LVITVDGPAAAGKSTVARVLAVKLGIRYLDTGALYRAVTWKALSSGTNMDDPNALARMARAADVRLEDGNQGLRVTCDGQDVTVAIRTPEVTRNIYKLADEPAVRRVLTDWQREFARARDVVTDGRDQGTEVFPDADVKFYLDASVERRAERRRRDLAAGTGSTTMAEVREDLKERDARDRSRPVGALRRSSDMVTIDSTDLTVEQVVDAMLAEVRRRGLMADGSGAELGVHR
jgi:cytidylate kinase